MKRPVSYLPTAGGWVLELVPAVGEVRAVVQVSLLLLVEVEAGRPSVPPPVVLQLVRTIEVGNGGRLRLKAGGGGVVVHALLLPQRPDHVHVVVHDGVVAGTVSGQLLPVQEDDNINSSYNRYFQTVAIDFFLFSR